MSQVLHFASALKSARIPLRVVPHGDAMDDFWPNVCRRAPAEDDVVVDPANMPKRVLSEVFALFAVVAVLVLAVTMLVPGPPL